MTSFDWKDIFLYTLILFLGIANFLLGVGWRSNADRIETLSKRNLVLEQRIDFIEGRAPPAVPRSQ